MMLNRALRRHGLQLLRSGGCTVGCTVGSTRRVATVPAFYTRRLTDSSPLAQFRHGKLNVTDIATKYCELRDFYNMLLDIKLETPAMSAGTKVHGDLESRADAMLPDEVVTPPEGVTLMQPQIMWVRLNNMLARINGLLAGTAIRELYVFGKLDDVLVTGFIDEVRVDSSSLVILDTKSRTRNSLPAKSQLLSAYHQVLVYHKLLYQMLRMTAGDGYFDPLYAYLECARDDPIVPIDVSDPHLDHGPISLGPTVRGSFSTLADLEAEVYRKMAILASRLDLADRIEVSYVRSSGPRIGSEVGRIAYTYSEDTLSQLTDFSMQFWKGLRNAIGVDPSEAAKCQYCPMAAKCEWRYTMERAEN